jgi:O-antigen/teichoic acid export membrane protein
MAAVHADTSAMGSSPKGLPIRQRLAGLARGGPHVLAWTDQGVVSAASFFLVVLIGRWTNPEELGAFALAMSILALFLAAQEALVTRPYSIHLHRPQGTPAEHAFGSLASGLLLSGLGAICLIVTALVLSGSRAGEQLVAITCALAAILPFVLLREFARRFAFAHLRMGRALWTDVTVAALNVAIVAWLGWTGRLSALTALGALGMSCGIGAIAWLYVARAEFAFRLGQIRATMRQSWGLGKWLVCGQIAIQAQGYATIWLATAIGGTGVTGVYAACMSIVGFANPLVFGFVNILTPRSVRALNLGGPSELRRQTARDCILLATLMGAFCLTIAVLGEPALRVLYSDPDYAGHGHLLSVLALASFVAAVGIPASIALTSAEHPRAVAAVMAITAILNVLLVWRFMSAWGLIGAAYAVLISETVGSLGRWATFLTIVRKIATPGPGREAEPPYPTRRPDDPPRGAETDANNGPTIGVSTCRPA